MAQALLAGGLRMPAHPGKCDHCHKLKEAYWDAIAEVALLERLKRSLDAESAPELVQDFDRQLELAEQARRAARDALNAHQIEKKH
jgi:hypothetical protein